ncbi:MAG: pantoate--beta-alanine ligase [Bacillota bacterium]|nr:pantoate--beta-alanine ligase [Bacillota bacterium]
MKVFNQIQAMQDWCKEKKQQGYSVGLVPTMGYLHEGHVTLVRQAKKQCDVVVVSIFVNPIQFGQGEDFEDYPRDLEKDNFLLEAEQVDAIFAPTAREMFPHGFNTFVEAYGEISQKLCAQARPGHFKGVTTVVSKLFHICLPEQAFFGQKDAQQVMIIEKMVRELNFPLEIVRVPIVREEDGLAKSSRNVYLTKEQRQQALVLNRSLRLAGEMIRDGERNVEKVKQLMVQCIQESPLAEIGYVEIYDGYDLSNIKEINGRALIALAVKFGKTRLIDNLLVEV